MKKQSKLELVWPGKDTWASPEPRILQEKKTFKAPSKGIQDNLLIHADNLLGLKALESQYAGTVKCVFIDPPYNTKSCFTHYDDNMEHSLWLNMMKERLILLKQFLRKDGTIWISIDDDECHYLKVLCDEIFGRKNFVANVVWQHSLQPKGYKNIFSVHHNHILIYKKSEDFSLKQIERTEVHNKAYANPDNDPKGPWRAGDVRNSLYRPNLMYDIRSPSGKIIKSPTNGWRWSKETLQQKIKTGEIFFSEDESRIIRKIYLKNQEGRSPETIWFAQEVGSTREANKEIKTIFQKDPFCTPKPERLIERILHLSTAPGDLVLDCFAGSGTTGAVAHKMGRRWIMIEMMDHCNTHIVPRMEMVIAGKDPGGVTEMTGWKGGGGFRYCELAPSLLEKTAHGRWIINKTYNPIMLAEAMCLHARYKFLPKREPYWMHGRSSERNFIYVTAELLSEAYLKRLNREVGPDRSLLVFCGAFQGSADAYDNLTIKKIPKSILNRCEWGRDDFALKKELQKEAKAANDREAVGSSSSEVVRVPMAASGGRQ